MSITINNLEYHSLKLLWPVVKIHVFNFLSLNYRLVSFWHWSDAAAEAAGPMVTRASLLQQSRRFSIDCAPQLQRAGGALTDLLISSDVGRYLEFKHVNALYNMSLNLSEPDARPTLFKVCYVSWWDVYFDQRIFQYFYRSFFRFFLFLHRYPAHVLKSSALRRFLSLTSEDWWRSVRALFIWIDAPTNFPVNYVHFTWIMKLFM